jgi:LEA14-like dessication related protein
MKKLLTPLVLLLGVVLFHAGCSNSGTIVVTGLRIEITGIERSSNGDVQVTWRLMNPNIVPYLLSRVSQKISLNNTLVGTTLDTAPIAIPAQDHATHTSKLTLAGGAASQVLAGAAGHGPVSYRVETALSIQLFGDMIERGDISGAGVVPVIAK